MKSCKLCMAVILCLLCLTGCGRDELPVEQEKTEMPTVDWKSEGFAVSEEVQERQALWASEYIRWQHEDVGNDEAERTVLVTELEDCGGRIYRLYAVWQPVSGGRAKYVLETYDTCSMQSALTELDSEKLGISDGVIVGMDVWEQGKYAFRILTTQQGEPEQIANNYMVYSDLGDNTEQVDVLSAYRDNGIADEVYNYECICDADGNSYVRAGAGEYGFRNLYILDREGRLLMEQKGDEYDGILEPLRMAEGELIFPINNMKEKTVRLVWFDTEKKEAHILASIEKDLLKRVYGIKGNDIYYESHDGIVKWDIALGNRTLVYGFDENGVPRVYNTMLVFREGQPPILRMYGTVSGEEEDWLVVLSEQETEKPAATRIVSLKGDSYNVQNCAAAASRRNPGLYFSYETCDEADLDDFRTGILAEMVAGGGPDILYVSLEDMKLLQSKGLLKDLNSLLSEDVLDGILPGVIKMGTVDGTLAGLAPEIDVTTVITLKSIWNQDTWCLEDILSLMDTGNYTGIFCQGTSSFAPRALLAFLTEYGLRDSSLVDWETGESRFEGELFLKILETAKTYGDNPIRTDAWLGDGGFLGEIQGGDFEEFGNLYEKYGDDFYFVGQPTVDGCGNYVKSDGVLVVNRNAADLNAVSAWFESLLSDEIQYAQRAGIHLSIRKVSPDEIKVIEAGDEKRAFWKDYELETEEKGRTLLKEYQDFLENCVPYPEGYDKILSVVWEEGQNYISGDRSAEDVAQVIDNRIQLYLDEGN